MKQIELYTEAKESNLNLTCICCADIDIHLAKGSFKIINVTFCLLIADKWVGGSIAKTPIADNFFISVFSAFYLAEEAFLSMFWLQMDKTH